MMDDGSSFGWPALIAAEPLGGGIPGGGLTGVIGPDFARVANDAPDFTE
jgi:hypothetical protein